MTNQSSPKSIDSRIGSVSSFYPFDCKERGEKNA